MARAYRFIEAKAGVVRLHGEHPDWNSRQIADALRTSTKNVRMINAMCGLNIPPAVRGRRYGWRKHGGQAGQQSAGHVV